MAHYSDFPEVMREMLKGASAVSVREDVPVPFEGSKSTVHLLDDGWYVQTHVYSRVEDVYRYALYDSATNCRAFVDVFRFFITSANAVPPARYQSPQFITTAWKAGPELARLLTELPAVLKSSPLNQLVVRSNDAAVNKQFRDANFVPDPIGKIPDDIPTSAPQCLVFYTKEARTGKSLRLKLNV
jgi:hypothetical protein